VRAIVARSETARPAMAKGAAGAGAEWIDSAGPGLTVQLKSGPPPPPDTQIGLLKDSIHNPQRAGLRVDGDGGGGDLLACGMVHLQE
jgi:hypothetical protein